MKYQTPFSEEKKIIIKEKYFYMSSAETFAKTVERKFGVKVKEQRLVQHYFKHINR